MKKRSIAYVVIDRGAPPKINGFPELIGLRVSLSSPDLHIKSLEVVPQPHEEPFGFWIVGTDKEAIKKEVCQRIDYIFDLQRMGEASQGEE